jgi:hypothetical protein
MEKSGTEMLDRTIPLQTPADSNPATLAASPLGRRQRDQLTVYAGVLTLAQVVEASVRPHDVMEGMLCDQLVACPQRRNAAACTRFGR